MPTPFIMPKMDMDQEVVTINEWLKKEGEVVEKGEAVVVIETDKITSEVEAPASGKLARILYHENEEAPVTKIIAYIINENETEADLPDIAEPHPDIGVNQSKSTLTIEKPQISSTAVAKRMAQAEGINLADIPFSGKKITKQDIEGYLQDKRKSETESKTPATPAARRIAEDKGITLNQIEGSGPRGRVQANDVLTLTAGQAPQELQVSPGEMLMLSSMRKRISERLTISYQTTPHINLNVEVDMSESEASRRRMNELGENEKNHQISLTAYLIRIISWCLKRHPFLNASLEEDKINLWKDINIGIATAIESGLIVPVIRNADQKTIRELNQKLRELTTKARSGELNREEIQGGTFTISNLGMYGIHSFTAIINPPQSAILAIGAIKRKPIVVDKEDSVEIRPVMSITLAADHRIVDGAVGANFLSDLVKALETPELLLI